MPSRRKIFWRLVIGFALVIAVLAICVWTVRRQRLSDPAQEQPHATLDTSSLSFTDGGAIPQRFACDGADLSPELRWAAAPPNTRSYAIVIDDVDAPLGFLHWLVYNIPFETLRIEEGASSLGKLPQGAAEGSNSKGTTEYSGPCPPGKQAHRYVVRLYALDLNPSLPAGKSRQAWVDAVKGHILAEGEIMGFYRRAGN
jgi:Raf kinase inhibitor-like YbhB/YbcL family protein